MIQEPSVLTIDSALVLQTSIGLDFIASLNTELDILLSDSERIDNSNKLVGQIKNGEQLILSKDNQIFSKVHKLSECMAEQYTDKFFKKYNRSNIFKSAISSEVWSVHQYNNDYNPIHNHRSYERKIGLSFILWTKIPSNMYNNNATSSFNSSGMLDGCTVLASTLNGPDYDFYPPGMKLFKPEIGKFIIFPDWLYHMVYPFSVDGERRTIAGNVELYTERKAASNIFGSENLEKWREKQMFY